MKWKELLKCEIEYTYKATDDLMALVKDDSLDWKPAASNNWMTTGRLLMHLTNACGQPIRGFSTGDWGVPVEEMSSDNPLPPAEKLPAVESVQQARRLLAEDKALALKTLDGCSEERLDTEIAKAPWDQMEMTLGQRFLQMVQHLFQHKGQLFYYLKLQGVPVNTMHLWGG